MGTKVPGNEGSWERTFQGTKVPPMELSFLERKFFGTKVPVTVQYLDMIYSTMDHHHNAQYNTIFFYCSRRQTAVKVTYTMTCTIV